MTNSDTEKTIIIKSKSRNLSCILLINKLRKYKRGVCLEKSNGNCINPFFNLIQKSYIIINLLFMSFLNYYSFYF